MHRPQTPSWHSAALAGVILLSSNAGWSASQGDPEGGPARPDANVQSVLVAAPPIVDGLADDPGWKAAPEASILTVKVDGYPTWPTSKVSLRSVHTDSEIFFIASWPDETLDDIRKPWTWDAAGKRYVESELGEDSVALSFELSGPFLPDMLAAMDAVWDVWHWKAGSTNPVGYAMDMTHRFSKTKPDQATEAKPFINYKEEKVWIARTEDVGASVQKKQEAPSSFQGDQIPQFIPSQPTESAADVRAKGRWSGGRWTVEFSRALDTHRADDAALREGHSIKMALALFDRGELVDHQTSGVITLSLAGPPVAAAVQPAMPPGVVGTWEMSNPMAPAGSNPTFSAFPDGRILIFSPDGHHQETTLEDGAIPMDGMLARPMLFKEDVLVLLYFNFEDEVFGTASVWSRVSDQPQEDHKFVPKPSLKTGP